MRAIARLGHDRRGLLKQALLNLMLNAVQARSPAIPRIKGTHPEGQHEDARVSIQVVDLDRNPEGDAR